MPIGLALARSAKTVSRAFDDALAAAGGSLPSWLILISLKTRTHANQRELAAAIGIQGATLTHHLNAMESAGLLVRRRDPANRRVHQVTMTDEGERLFHRLRRAATEFDRQLRAGLDDGDLDALTRMLGTLAGNVATGTADPADALPNPAAAH
jgi:MarR family transcriptional regulator for hemolysin